MKGLPRYSLVAVLTVAIAVGASWMFFDGPARASVLVAAAIALPIQLGLFGLLESAGRDSQRFLVWWGVGMLGRMAVLAGVALTVARLEGLDATALVMSTAGLLFFLLLLEPLFLTRPGDSERYAR